MIITTKYNVGQQVWIFEHKEILCQKCGHLGMSTMAELCSGEITSWCRKHDGTIEYAIKIPENFDESLIEESKVFPTCAEAEAEIQRRKE